MADLFVYTSLGWIRDVILKSPDGMEAGQVSYISPDGTMVRSYKDLALARMS